MFMTTITTTNTIIIIITATMMIDCGISIIIISIVMIMIECGTREWRKGFLSWNLSSPVEAEVRFLFTIANNEYCFFTHHHNDDDSVNMGRN